MIPRSLSTARTSVASLLVAALLGLVATNPAGAADDPEPTPTDPLQQTIDSDQEVAENAAILSAGHVDLGPRFDEGGGWTLMVHDDTDIAGSVWRHLDKTVVRVNDQALQTVPDDPAYSFLGVDPGTDVHVVPQTQNLDVVWLGWNTQDPEVRSSIDRGLTLSLESVDGPGRVVVYLQDGGFGEPDVLWDSASTEVQPLFVDVNTHTHANWVFSQPGVYLMTLSATATTVAGEELTTSGTVRFAVGDQTDAQEALAADRPPPQTGAAEDRSDDQSGAADPADEGSGDRGAAWLLAGAAVALVSGLVLLVVRGSRVRARALRDAPEAGS